MAPVIEVQSLKKTFKSQLKGTGLKGSLKSLFSPEYRTVDAVDNISFSVEKGITSFLISHDAGDIEKICMKMDGYQLRQSCLGRNGKGDEIQTV